MHAEQLILPDISIGRPEKKRHFVKHTLYSPNGRSLMQTINTLASERAMIV